MRKPAYITVEEGTGDTDLNGIALLVTNDFSNIDIKIIEDTGYYFVLHFIYEDFDEVKDVASTISYIMINEGIYKYTMTVNTNE